MTEPVDQQDQLSSGIAQNQQIKTQEQSDNALELKQRVVVKNKTKCDKKAKRGKCKDCDLIC